MKIKKIAIGVLASLSLLTACGTGNNSTDSILPSKTKTYPAIELPYEIADDYYEELDEIIGVTHDYQVLEKVTTREITEEENQYFKERLRTSTLNDLNQVYTAVVFHFGDATVLSRGNSIDNFPYSINKSYFVYDDVNTSILEFEKFHQKQNYSDRDRYTAEDKDLGKNIHYGSSFKNYEVVALVNTDYVKKGLQLRTILDEEVIYIDIK